MTVCHCCLVPDELGNTSMGITIDYVSATDDFRFGFWLTMSAMIAMGDWLQIEILKVCHCRSALLTVKTV